MARRSNPSRRSKPARRPEDVLAQVRSRPAESAQLGREVAAALGSLVRTENFDGTLRVEGIPGSQWTIHDYALGSVEFRRDGLRVSRRTLVGLGDHQSFVLEPPFRGETLIVHRDGYLKVVKLGFKAISTGPFASMCLATSRSLIKRPASDIHFQQLAAQILSGVLGDAVDSAGLSAAGTPLRRLAQRGLSGGSGVKPLG